MMFPPQFTPAEMASLQKAYEGAIYEVYSGKDIIQLTIGRHCPEIDRIITLKAVRSWALITAYNPYSQCLSTTENQQRHQKLLDRLADLRLTSLAAVGRDKNNLWTPEISLLILEIPRSEAIAIGRQFQQNAIVYGELHQPVELLWLNSEKHA